MLGPMPPTASIWGVMPAMDSDEPVRSARGTIILFLVVTFALDWVSWILAGAQSGWAIDESSGVWGPLLAVSMFGPLAAAIIVRVTRKKPPPTPVGGLASKVAYAGICLRWLSHQPLRLPAPWCTFSSSPGTSIRGIALLRCRHRPAWRRRRPGSGNLCRSGCQCCAFRPIHQHAAGRW